MEIAKREISRKGVLAGAALFVPLERAARTQSLSARLPGSQLPQPFQVGFARPPVLKPVLRRGDTDFYRIVQRQAGVQIAPGLPKTRIFGYNGITPGPTIVARRGRKVVVRQINGLPRGINPAHGHENTTSTHLHGSDTPPQYDGYANDTTRPGWFKDYRYPDDQDARTIWYHDHAVHHTAFNAYMGLAGLYILRDGLESKLPIPHGRYDVPVVLKDAVLSQNGQLIFDTQNDSSLMGDIILVNGKPWPVMRVERRKYRFRFLNVSISRGYRLALSTGEPLIVIGTDGGLMPRPVEVQRMNIGMAERYEVVIDFAKYRVGQEVILRNLGLPNNADHASTRQIMRFDVVSDAKDRRNNSVPDRLNPSKGTYNPMKLKESDATGPRRRFRFHRKNGMWVINDKTWDPSRVDANPALNSVEVWECTNKSGGWFHPFHIHLIDFQIIGRGKDGQSPPFPYERGPKDVMYIGEGETVKIVARFGPRKGRYMMHCHNLVHEDHDMMLQMEVGKGGPSPLSARAKPISRRKPF
jgi:FtsP/CotA-like multicopper oxidase with cupredoxin domain